MGWVVFKCSCGQTHRQAWRALACGEAGAATYVQLPVGHCDAAPVTDTLTTVVDTLAV